MKATILAPFLLATSTLALPAPKETTEPALTCFQRSTQFKSWDLTSFTYSPPTAATPTNSSAPSRASVSFTVINSVIDPQVKCVAESDKAFDGAEKFKCDGPPVDDPATYQGGAVEFSFDAASGNVTLMQRWICHDDPVWPSYLTGVGSGIADLSCLGEGVVSGESVEDTSESPGCAGLTVTVNLTEISAIA
ncbi:hypothetical protein SAPIO_CDS1533 [Scedosporium apiospermum]|uniref:AA1-like domain-containing protein n=1 Tax=Pseudallescheria apiosperma TaxID=563466 RepID=A0A084GEH8_PSEDA|nr:uncharacterized protein SAPIO_CDS1533 [Scedosporium apiospermum]KEZ45740.1 hypothetical protein SAPIO_CDS1533 [Scedosporium apiospermum]